MIGIIKKFNWFWFIWFIWFDDENWGRKPPFFFKQNDSFFIKQLW